MTDPTTAPGKINSGKTNSENTNAGKIIVEVAYARPDSQLIVPVEIEPGATALTAIEQSGILYIYPEIDMELAKIGIFGKVCKKDQVLREKDRVEIYRPLIADPKEVRKKRAAAGKKMRKGGGDK